MPNPHGSFIWYEIMSPDPDATTRFYDEVVGWKIDAERPGDDWDYRMIAAPEGLVGGVLKLDEAMIAGGARPAWLGYVGVDDVDRTVADCTAAGGRVYVPARDVPGVGRFALLADPHGAPFYVMRGSSDDSSTAFAPDKPGHCAWNELRTSDQDAAFAFYGGLFGWSKAGAMPMGEMGDYSFIGGPQERMGAIMTAGQQPVAWVFYFRVDDIDVAAERVRTAGGIVHHGPAEVPGGDRVIHASDPQGAAFGLVGPGK